MQTKFINGLLVAILFITLTSSCKKLNDAGNLVPKTVDEDASLPAIQVNDRLLHSEAFGPLDSTLVICIHGGPSADYLYMMKAKDLANHGFRVVFYDQIGSGLSQRFDEEYYSGKGVNEIFLSELSGVINHYKTNPQQKVVLLGHSWGAIMATAYAGQHPNEIDGLVLMEPGGLKWDDIIDYIKRSQGLKLWSELLNDITYQDKFIGNDKNNHEVLDYKLALMGGQYFPESGESLLAPGSFWRTGSVINMISFNTGQRDKPDMSTGIENFVNPVLFFYGDNSAYPDSWAEKISSVYPNKTVFKTTGVGHSGMLTDTNTWQNTSLPLIVNFINAL